jgi:hypothetical protein
LYWAAYSNNVRRNSRRENPRQKAREYSGIDCRSENNERVAYMPSAGFQEQPDHAGIPGQADGNVAGQDANRSCGLGDAEHDGHFAEQITASNVQPSAERRQNWQNFSSESEGASRSDNVSSLSGCENGRGEWHNPDWIYCRDGKHRPVEPGIKPLVNGIPKGMVRSGDKSAPINADETSEARVMRLKGYGNAVCPQVAALFIESVIDLLTELSVS